MRFLKLTFRILGFLTAVTILLPLLVLAVLQVPAGQAFVSGLVSHFASSDAQTVRIEGLHVGFNLDAKVENVSVGDAEGDWLQVGEVGLTWSPLSLLAGDLDIVSLSVGQVDLIRQPAAEAASSGGETDTADSTSGFSLPLNVSLDRLSVGEINLGEPLLGAPMSLTASGAASFALEPALFKADLDVHRIDGVDASLTAKAEFEPAAEALAFDITVSEPRGGLAARLLDVPDLPALQMELTGQGPLTDWAANLSLALDGRETVSGSAKIEEIEGQRHLSFDLDGDLAPLAPPSAQALVLGTTKATGNAVFSKDFAPHSANLNLKTSTVSLDASAGLEGAAVNATGTLAVSAGDNALIAVDIGERRIAFGPLKAHVAVSGAQSAADWSAKVNLASIQTSEARTGAIDLELSGAAADLTPDVLTSPFSLSLEIADLEGLTPQTEPLSGPVSLKGDGTLDASRQTLTIANLSANLSNATVSLTETGLSPKSVAGQGSFSLADLSKFSGFAGRDLGGNMSGTFSADLDPTKIKGSAAISIVSHDLITGIAQADALLNGESGLDMSLDMAGLDDIGIKNLSLKNAALKVSGEARYQQASLTSSVEASLADLAKLDPQLSGALTLDVKTSGPIDALAVEAQANSKQILLAGTPLDDLSLRAEATADLAAPTAKVKGSASLNGQPVAVDVVLKSEDGGAAVDPLSVDVAGNKVTGSLAVADLNNALETLQGDLKIDAPDLASLSPLLLTEITGRIEGTASADPDNKSLLLDVTGSDIAVPSLSLGSVRLKANLSAPYAPETVTADIVLSDLVTDLTPVHSVNIQAMPEGDGTAVTAAASLDTSGKDGVTLAAHISEPDAGSYAVALSQLAMHYQGIDSRLKQPATITFANSNVTIQPLELQLGQGALTVSGTAGDRLDLTASLTSVPVNLANAFVPSLGLGGTLSGKATATGSASRPVAEWSITGSGLTAAELRTNGLSALGLDTSGTLKDNRITQTTRVSDPNGLNLSASGTVGLDAPMPISLTLDGTVPTAALRRPLLEADLRADGAVALKGKVGGNAGAPSYQITATPSGLKITSLSTGLTIQNIRGSAAVTQDRASLDGIAGDLATGGTLTASGTVGMKDGFPADLAVKLNQGRYVDPGLVTADVTADLKISGPLASPSNSALIGGQITINKADVSIPEYLPGAIPPVDVRHVNAPKAVRQQVAEMGGEPKGSQTQQRSQPPRLDIILSAPGRIFIRGRGLDAELQGNLKIAGTTADPQAVGAFSLKRGQLEILTRRLVFSRGSATFEGSLTPLIDFAATTTVNNTTITVSVSGQADDPQITFSSSPELPQDEVLALLLFGKSVGNLSPTQVARLAAAIATLTGGSDNGPLAAIRKSLGLDAIDINTDGENGPSVSVGKYINDNIYLGVEQGTGSNSSRVKVDIDLDRGLKVRGEVGADGSSKAGIFFEREY